MKNVEKFATPAAREALEILNQAWAYFTPQPKPALDGSDKDAPQNFAYYDAA